MKSYACLCLLLAGVFCVACFSGACADELPPTLKPQVNPRAVYDWKKRHEAVMERNRTVKPEYVVFGDSITHRWGGEPSGDNRALGTGKTAWDSLFSSHAVTNMGFGSDYVDNAYYRLTRERGWWACRPQEDRPAEPGSPRQHLQQALPGHVPGQLPLRGGYQESGQPRPQQWKEQYRLPENCPKLFQPLPKWEPRMHTDGAGRKQRKRSHCAPVLPSPRARSSGQRRKQRQERWTGKRPQPWIPSHPSHDRTHQP